MIVEAGRVAQLQDDFAWVVCAAQANCTRCAEGRGCGGGLLGRLLGDRLHRVRALRGELALCEGDQVEIGLDEAAILKGALWIYGTPLAGLVGVPLMLRGVFAPESELFMLVAGITGFLAGLAVAKWRTDRLAMNPLFQPVITRRLEKQCVGHS